MSRARRGLAVAATLTVLLPATDAAAGGDPLRGQQWHLDAIHADEAHRVSTGDGVTVAVVDSGVDAAHPDLAGQVTTGEDLVGPGPRHPHGTLVAGIIAARSGNDIGLAGAAPGARVLAIRVLDGQGFGSSAVEARGIDAAVAAGAEVVNLSLGPAPELFDLLNPGDPLLAAITRATRAGVVVVAAAGNGDRPVCAQPVLGPGLLCVGSVGRDLRRSDFSNHGLRTDVVAPGEDVFSTVPGDGYGGLSGTSAATPQVAAQAALLVARGLRGQAVADRIRRTAADLGTRGPDLEHGWGLVNLEASVAGLGPQGPARPRGSGVPVLRIRVAGSASARIVRRRGLRVRVSSPMAGPCRGRLLVRGRAVAQGTRVLRRPGRVVLTLRPGRASRRLVRRGPAQVELTCSPAPRATLRILLRR